MQFAPHLYGEGIQAVWSIEAQNGDPVLIGSSYELCLVCRDAESRFLSTLVPGLCVRSAVDRNREEGLFVESHQALLCNRCDESSGLIVKGASTQTSGATREWAVLGI